MSRRLQEPNAETDPGALSPCRTLSPVPASLPQTSVLWRLLLTRRARPGPSRPAPPAGPARAPGSETTCPRSCSCSFSGENRSRPHPLTGAHREDPTFSSVSHTPSPPWLKSPISGLDAAPASSLSPTPVTTSRKAPGVPAARWAPPLGPNLPPRAAPRPRRPFQARWHRANSSTTSVALDARGPPQEARPRPPRPAQVSGGTPAAVRPRAPAHPLWTPPGLRAGGRSRGGGGAP
ncbi:hypothetical protein J1605_022489 [Eschrichtius robustus]|uniref:Uncharacterized protein n=1 Tax=Eschrichtius robustus TaxID=9764 RepID=A0AB34H9I5_ESCRO|nr:hypothetical protein J1605_022489 [Eschrichtius robustus]